MKKTPFNESIQMLKNHKKLIFFPLISSVFITLIMLSFFGISHGSFVEEKLGVLTSKVALFAYYLISFFITIFFSSALVACAYMYMVGREPTIKFGLSYAFKNIHKIFVWSLISATIGLLLRILPRRAKSSRMRLISEIIASIFGMAWSMLTFFIVPILIFEKLSLIQSIKRSGELFKKTFGEIIVGYTWLFGFFFASGLLGISLILILGLGIIDVLHLDIKEPFLIVWPVVILYGFILGIIASTIWEIFRTAVYYYAYNRKLPAGFSFESLDKAVKKPQPKM